MDDHEKALREIIEKQLKISGGKPPIMTVIQYTSAEDASVPDEKIDDWNAYLAKYNKSITILKEYGVDVFEVVFLRTDYRKWIKGKGFADTRAMRAAWAQTRL